MTEISPRHRVAKGPKRPRYLQDPELDRFMMMFTALMAEVTATRERLDTHEALAAQGMVATPAAVEAFAPSPEIAKVRAEAREATMRRVFRVLLEELEQARTAASESDLEAVLAEDESRSAVPAGA